MGRALLRLGQPDEAIVSVSRPAEMFKADSELEAYSQSLGLLGECLRGAGRHAEALELYTEMYELTSDENSGMTPSVAALTRPHARGAIALCLSELGRHAEALTLFGQFPVAPSKGRCMVRLAESLAAAGRIGESRQTCL
ncbi:tetratricopeptide repeat protein [Nonomuraea bangladeshensis]|uniref:tetratricopeptide repeat protein n=1 Tax=Nonomuraea bangladeshensis TaxID=404385 RepID=UPI0031E30113